VALPQQTIKEDPVRLTAVEGGKSGGPKWIGWSILGALLIAVAVLVVQVVEINPDDGSSQQVETERFNGLAPVGDNSSEAAEAVRFGQYQPATSDNSSDTAEAVRFGQYQTARSDRSNEAAESSRMMGLLPSNNGGSSETAEHIRMIGLAS
jgi:hypothetical protein